MTDYVPDYIEWDGSEWTLEKILIRWGKTTLEYPRAGEGIALECSTGGMARKYATAIVPVWKDERKTVEFELGDRIYFKTHIYHSPNPGVIELHNPEDHFKITGRGTCFSSSKWKLPEGIWEPWDLASRPATINGIAVRITGVDAFASHRSPTSPYRHSFAVMVSEEDGKKVTYQ